MHQLQIISYRGRIVAAATHTWFWLSDELERRPASDPECAFVVYMCAYARDVLTGVLPGPYTELAARRFARACLIPDELIERAGLDIDRAAQTLQVPADELRAARAQHAASSVTATAVP